MMTDESNYEFGEGYGRATGSGYDFGYSLDPSSMGYGHGCSEGYGDMVSEGTGTGKSAGYGLEWKDLLPSGCGYGTSTGAGGLNGHNGWGYGSSGGTKYNQI